MDDAAIEHSRFHFFSLKTIQAAPQLRTLPRLPQKLVSQRDKDKKYQRKPIDWKQLPPPLRALLSRFSF